jgi:Uma2 family endonuclease
MHEPTIRTRRWTRREYDRLIGLGVLDEDDPIELVAGRLIVAEPQNDPHARAIELVAEAMKTACGPGWRVRVQLPLALGRDSEPDPDIAVVFGSARDAPPGHPTTAALVIEVADASLRVDRGLKARVYARAGIDDYWIVNLVNRTVEVRREPVRQRFHVARYASVQIAGVAAPVAAGPSRRVDTRE